MADLTLDTINKTLRTILPDPRSVFKVDHPLTGDILSAQMRPLGEGSSIDFHLHTGSPAKGTSILSGSDLIPSTRTSISKELSVDTHRIAAIISIPYRDIDRQKNTPAGATRIIEDYPIAFLESTKQCVESFMTIGQVVSTGTNPAFDALDLSGFPTLYGDFTSTLGIRGVTAGLISFAAPSAQTAVTQGLAKSNAYGYYNHYRAASAWGTDGPEKLGSLIRAVRQYNSNRKMRGLADPDTITQMDLYQKSFYQSTRANGGVGEDSAYKIMFNGIEFCESVFMDVANVSGAPATGFGYVLTPEDFEAYERYGMKLTEFMENVIFQQDVAAAKFKWDWGLVMRNALTQGAFTGTAA
jgi:hypothetical protein